MVDWLDVELTLGSPTQFQWINRNVKEVVGRRGWIEPLDPGAGGRATDFRMRLQEPNFREAKEIVERVANRWGLSRSPSIAGLELSIDFYPKEPSGKSRALMHGVLTRHFLPPPGALVTDHDWPGFFPGPHDRRNFIVGRNMSDDSLDLWRRLQPATDLQPFYDSTLYVGRENHELASWRIQNKVVDQQKVSAGTTRVLEEDEKRIRIEVTLGRTGCRSVGLDRFDVLRDFRFMHLQKFFRFMLPTFGLSERASLARPAIRERMVEYSKHRFFAAGVLGLQIMEAAREELRRDNLPNIKRQHRLMGTRMPSGYRAGTGAAGTLLAFDHLNKAVEQALRHLQERVWREMKD
ncbi:hypothetical protein [Rhizobium sp. RAF56]|uniref:hypothetical protein n=1 Tax=Rhizobium sp. RAF56 TaxID=3233062 RepID=UPI003F9436C2